MSKNNDNIKNQTNKNRPNGITAVRMAEITTDFGVSLSNSSEVRESITQNNTLYKNLFNSSFALLFFPYSTDHEAENIPKFSQEIPESTI